MFNVVLFESVVVLSLSKVLGGFRRFFFVVVLRVFEGFIFLRFRRFWGFLLFFGGIIFRFLGNLFGPLWS